jgi:hypothetical protein
MMMMRLLVPDPVPQAARIRRRIAQMVVRYQNKGRYMDLDGNWHTDTTGILNAWEELDALGVKL